MIIEWLLDQDLIPIPRSSNPEHIKENFQGFVNWRDGGVIGKEDL